MEEESVMISQMNSIKSINDDDDETCSMDSSFAVVNKDKSSAFPVPQPPSIRTAVREENEQPNGDRYEMRADIKQVLNDLNLSFLLIINVILFTPWADLKEMHKIVYN